MEQAAAQASASGWLARAGHVLFRWRSFTPVPLLALAIPLLWMGRGGAHSPAWLWGGALLCVLGQGWRAWVIGQVPDGTSGQNESLVATTLNTSGPYALTRNPLYLGNFAITLGLCLIAHAPLLLAAVALLFGLQYRAIIAVEEGFLRARFGAAFDAYCARVPRFWPRWPATDDPARSPWSGRRALRKEHNPCAAWLLIAIVLLALDRLAEGTLSSASLSNAAAGLWPHAAAFALVLALFLAIKAWKHRWLSGGFREDLRRRVRETSR